MPTRPTFSLTPTFHTRKTSLDIWSSSGSVPVIEIYRVTARPGWLRYLREEQLLVARIPDDFTREADKIVADILAKLRSAA